MSKVKFAAAKELIQEQHYDAARAVLRTINEPQAGQWLRKLEQIAPEFPAAAPFSNEQERFYRNQNQDRRRRRIGNGVDLILMAIGCFFLFAVFAYFGNINNDNGTVQLGLEILLIPLGVIGLIVGFRRVSRD